MGFFSLSNDVGVDADVCHSGVENVSITTALDYAWINKMFAQKNIRVGIDYNSRREKLRDF